MTNYVVTIVADHGLWTAEPSRVIEFDETSGSLLKCVAGGQFLCGIGSNNRFCVVTNHPLVPGKHTVRISTRPGALVTSIYHIGKYTDASSASIGVDTSHKEEELRAFGEIMKTLGTYSNLFIAHPEYAKLVKDYVQLHLDEAKK